MNLPRFFNTFLVKEKEKVTEEEFVHYLSKKEMYHHMVDSRGAFGSLLHSLYKTENNLYKDYYSSFSKMDYSLTKKNIEILEEIVKNGSEAELIQAVFEMLKKENSIVQRHVATFKKITPKTKEDYETVIARFEEIKEVAQDDDNPILSICRKSFKKECGEITDPILIKCYDMCYSRLKKDIIDCVSEYYNQCRRVYEKTYVHKDINEFYFSKVKKRER